MLVRRLECRRFGLGIALLLIPRAGGDMLGRKARKLLFFQPVLLEARERSQSWVRRVSLTPALFVVQVGAAIGAQTAAVTLANHF